ALSELGQLLHEWVRELGAADSRRRLDQLGKCPADGLAGRTGALCSGQCGAMVPEAVVEDGPRVLDDGDRPTLAPSVGVLEHLLGVPGLVRLEAAPAGEVDLGEVDGRAPGRG